MPLATEMLAEVEAGGNVQLSHGQSLQIKQNARKEMLVGGGLPPYALHTALGERFSTKTATAFAPIVVIPSTLAHLEITNNHATKYMIVDAIWAWTLVGAASAIAHTVWGQVGLSVQSSVTGLKIGNSVGNLEITSAANSDAVTAINQTVVASGWDVFPGSGGDGNLGAALPGGLNIGRVDGRLVVPPGKALHIASVGTIATASSKHVGASWYLSEIV